MGTTTTTTTDIYRDGNPTFPLTGFAFEAWITINWKFGTALANECLAHTEVWNGLVEWLETEAWRDGGDGCTVMDVDADIFACFPCLYGMTLAEFEARGYVSE